MKKVIIISALVLVSIFTVKTYKQIEITRQIECEKKIGRVNSNIMLGIGMSLETLSAVSEIWDAAMNYGLDSKKPLADYFEKIKQGGNIKKMEEMNLLILEGIKELKESRIANKEAYTILIDLYGIHSQLYELALNPTGSLKSFDSKVADLYLEYKKISSSFKMAMQNDER